MFCLGHSKENKWHLFRFRVYIVLNCEILENQIAPHYNWVEFIVSVVRENQEIIKFPVCDSPVQVYTLQ